MMPLQRNLSLGLLGLTLAGCSALGPQTDPSLDPDSGEMVVALREAVVYTKAQPGLSPSAHDYVYLGPVEANASGNQALYLWVGFASTIDRGRSGTHEGQFDAIVFESADREITLPLETWHQDTRDSPYTIKVPLLQSMRARIEPADLEHLAGTGEVELALLASNGLQHSFAHWNGQWSDWQNASDEAEVGFSVRVRTPDNP